MDAGNDWNRKWIDSVHRYRRTKKGSESQVKQ